MKKYFTIIVGTLIALICLHFDVTGQSKDSEIQIEIIKEINGEKKSLKKSYTSIEEMKNDKDYQEFVGEDSGHWLHLNSDSEQLVNIDINTHGSFAFANDKDVMQLEMGKLSEEMAKMEVHIQRVLEEEDQNIQKKIDKVMKTYHDDESTFFYSFSDDGDDFSLAVNDISTNDFSKTAVPGKNEQLPVDPLNIKVVGHHVLVKYPITNTATVSVKLFDKTDDLLFANKVPETTSDINQMIDLSAYKKGDYWLELTVDDKRLTKKITVDRKE